MNKETIMKESSLTFASIGAAIAASLCCIGPLVAVVLGLGTFGAAAAFEKFRPYSLGLTGLLLAGAWHLAYRSRKTGACADGACPPKSPARYSKAMLWFATGLVGLFAAFPYYSPLVWKKLGQTHSLGAPAPLSSQPTPAAVSCVTLKVEGMTCGGCAAAVQSSLSRLNGVSEASVSFEEKTGTVKYDSSRLTPEQIIQAIEKVGYKATVKR